MAVDSFDARLLAEIQRNTRTPSEVLAEKVGLSPSAVQRRLKALRTEGVIEAEVAILNPKAVGQNVTMVVLVGLERERDDIVDRFKRAIRETPQVQSGFLVTGDADFVVTVTAANIEEYEVFIRTFFRGNPDIKWYKTLVVLDRVKVGNTLPIDPARFK